jgi:phosphomannomutase
MSVFKAYDIRGTYPDQIDAHLAYRIGRAFADFVGNGPLAIGHDMRTMAPEIHQACMQGVLDGGLDVIDLGLCSTPQVYFSIGHLGAAGGLNVTASHNPSQYIGFKLCGAKAVPISGDTGLKKIEEMATAASDPAPTVEKGSMTSANTMKDYVAHVSKWSDLGRPVKIASDAANGMAAHTFPEILRANPEIQHEGLFYELDGSFPNHEANPLKISTLADLRKLVVESGAELGAAFDGDSDRCCFVDETGRPIGNDIMTTLVAKEILKHEPGAAIVYDLRSSWILPKTILELGGRPVKERVGHSFLKARMKENDAPFGGELSGHYYFRDNWYADNAEIILLSVLNLISRSDRPFSAMLDELMCFHSTGEVNFEVEDKEAALRKLKEAFADGKQDELDGITISYGTVTDKDWWWVNLRASNTEPLLRMNLESDNLDIMNQRKEQVFEILGVHPEA